MLSFYKTSSNYICNAFAWKDTHHVCSHPNLPQLLGFSADGVPTPFIVLSNGWSSVCGVEARA